METKEINQPGTMQYARGLEAMYESIGFSLMTDEFACKLLAWLSVLGGYTEETVVNAKLNTGLAFAQQKLNIIGGQVPNYKLLPLLQKYTKELKETGEKTEWLPEIYTRYGFNNEKKGKKK